MELVMPTDSAPNLPHHSAALVKLQATSWALRLLSGVYAAWALWNIQNWWLNAERVSRHMGTYLERDLSGMERWQRLACLGVDLVAWAMLLAAVVFGWKFMGNLANKVWPSQVGAKALMRCAYWASACELYSIVTRPLNTWLLTSHLDPEQRVWRWAVQTHDVQSLILCLVLVVSALMLSWALAIAEENRSFV
jgi:hypothetical protein